MHLLFFLFFRFLSLSQIQYSIVFSSYQYRLAACEWLSALEWRLAFEWVPALSGLEEELGRQSRSVVVQSTPFFGRVRSSQLSLIRK